MFKLLKKLYYRRKAVSPVVATILLIAITVAAVAFIYFYLVPMLRRHRLDASIILIQDTNKDSMYDRITVQFVNSGTQNAEVYNLTIWIASYNDLGNSEHWIPHLGWEFEIPGDKIIAPSDIIETKLTGETQIGLTILEDTYYRLEIEYSGSRNPIFTDWARLNDFVDLSDLLATFENFNLTAWAFDGTIDDPRRAANNYLTNADGDYQLNQEEINFLPVLDEEELIPFFVGSRLVVFHSTNGNLSEQPLKQTFDVSDTPFRAKKLFLLGLAGSWGDIFPLHDYALNLTIVYTDNSRNNYLLNHSYIDDWWMYSNNYPPPNGPRYNGCLSYDKYGTGFITKIDLGTQTDTPHSHIHTHSTRFLFDYYKYVKAIIFQDPGDDQSGPHLLSITFR